MPPTFWRLNSAGPLSGFSLKTRKSTQSNKSHYWSLINNYVDYAQDDDHPDDNHCSTYISLERNKITINTFCADAELDNNDDDSQFSKVIVMMRMINA